MDIFRQNISETKIDQTHKNVNKNSKKNYIRNNNEYCWCFVKEIDICMT